MKLIPIFIICLALASCAARITTPVDSESNKPVLIYSSNDYDKSWNKMYFYLFEKGCTIVAMNKDEGVLSVQMNNAIITCKNSKGILINDSALAITDTRKRMNNNAMVYALTGQLTWHIYVKKEEEKSLVYIRLDNSGSITSFLEGKIKRIKTIKNCTMKSTGNFETKLKTALDQ